MGGIWGSEIMPADHTNGLANSGKVITAVTNKLSAPFKLDDAAWSNTTAGVRLTSNTIRFDGSAGNQVGQGSVSVTAGHTYLAVIEARALSIMDSTKTTMYPSLMISLSDPNIYLTTYDYDYSTFRGNLCSLRPKLTNHSTRYTASATGSTGAFLIRDPSDQGQAITAEVAFAGVYDITGLSGVIYDASSNRYFDLDTTINFWGDSQSRNLHQMRDAMGWTLTKHNCLRTITGNSNSNTTISGVSSTSGIPTDGSWEILGNGIPTGTLITGSTSNTLTISQAATATVTGDTFRIGYDGSGRTTSGVLSAMQSAIALEPSAATNDTIIWCGHNNVPSVGNVSLATAKADLIAMTSLLSGDFRILTLLYNSGWVNPRTSNADYIDALNEWILNYFGSRAIDIRGAVLAAGNASTTDITNIQWNCTPASLRNDAIHVNDRGADVLADFIANKLGTAWS